MNENEEKGTAPLISSLEIIEIFKNKGKKGEASIIDFIN